MLGFGTLLRASIIELRVIALPRHWLLTLPMVLVLRAHCRLPSFN